MFIGLKSEASAKVSALWTHCSS